MNSNNDQADLEVQYILCVRNEGFTKSNFLAYKPEPGKPFFVLRMLFVCKNKKQTQPNMENEPVVGEMDSAYLEKHGAKKCRDLLIEHGFFKIDSEELEKVYSIYMPENLVVESEENPSKG